MKKFAFILMVISFSIKATEYNYVPIIAAWEATPQSCRWSESVKTYTVIRRYNAHPLTGSNGIPERVCSEKEHEDTKDQAKRNARTECLEQGGIPLGMDCTSDSVGRYIRYGCSIVCQKERADYITGIIVEPEEILCDQFTGYGAIQITTRENNTLLTAWYKVKSKDLCSEYEGHSSKLLKIADQEQVPTFKLDPDNNITGIKESMKISEFINGIEATTNVTIGQTNDIQEWFNNLVSTTQH